MTATPETPNALAAEIGPFYDAYAVKTLLDVPEDDLVAMREAHRLLAVETSDSVSVYPVFQFAGGQVNPALAPAIQAFAGSPAWAAALWFVTPTDDLDDMTPLAWLEAGHRPDAVTASARRTARAWR